MTFAEIRADICRRLDKNAVNLDPETKRRLDTFINDRYRELLRLDGINLRDESFTLVTETGRWRYALPAVVTQIYNIVNTQTRLGLRQVTLAWIRRADPRWPVSTQGTPQVYAILNEAGIGLQPSVFTTGALEVVGFPGDTRDVTIEFMEATTGSFQTVTVTLNGNTPVLVPPAIRNVYRFYTDEAGPQSGSIVVLRETATPTRIITQLPTVGTSGPGMPQVMATHAWVIALWPTPHNNITLLIDHARPRRALVDDSDEPAIPEEFHTALVWGGCSEECLKMDDSRHQYYEGKYQDDVRHLRAFLHHSRGERWVPGRRRRGWSDLGGNFPANRW